MSIQSQGIVEPPVDRLLSKSDSKYGLVIVAARRARQINAYYSQLHEGLFEYVGPMVDVDMNEKSLSVAMREIDGGVIVSSADESGGFSENGQVNEMDGSADFYGANFFDTSTDLDSAMMFSDSNAPDDSVDASADGPVESEQPDTTAAQEMADEPADEPSEQN